MTDHNDPTWPYDEDGFAKGLPADHPGRRVMAALDILTGNAEEKAWKKAMARTDYTDEFRLFLADFPDLAKNVTATRQRDFENFDFEFEVRAIYQGQQYSMVQMLSPYEAKQSLEHFVRARQRVWEYMAHALLAKTGLLTVRRDLALAKRVYEFLTDEHASWLIVDPILMRSLRSYVDEARTARQDYLRYRDARMQTRAEECIYETLRHADQYLHLKERTENSPDRHYQIFQEVFRLVTEGIEA